MREHYHQLLAHPGEIEALLRAGAAKARAVATPFMAELRHAVGLRNLESVSAASAKTGTAKTAVPAFKQYRENDGKFYFKLLSASGRTLLQSRSFEAPKDAALAIATLQKDGAGALGGLRDKLEIASGVTNDDIVGVLDFFGSAGKS